MARRQSGLGQDALLDFQMEVTLDGERLTAAEIRELLEKSDGLALVRGRWVEVDRERLRRMLEHFREVERTAAENGLGFREAARLLAGADVAAGDASADARAEWSQVVAGPWLAETLKGLRSPEGLARIDPGAALNATLRPYQQVGVRWLYLLAKLGLGACLADDMGWARPSRCWRCCWCSSAKRPASSSPACWWRPLRCWPIGHRRSNVLRLA